MNPAMARTYLQVAVFKPSMAREFSQAAVDELKTLIPAILTTAGSYLLSDWVARKLNLPEGSRPDPGAFVDMIRQAPIAPAKIAFVSRKETPVATAHGYGYPVRMSARITPRDEGGQPYPVFPDDKLRFKFKDGTVARGTLDLGGAEMLMPGDEVLATAYLSKPVSPKSQSVTATRGLLSLRRVVEGKVLREKEFSRRREEQKRWFEKYNPPKDKVATAGGGEMIIPPESLATWKRSVALSEARRVSDEKSAREALRDVLRRKGVQV